MRESVSVVPDHPELTRRDVVRLTLAAAATAALVGCTRQSGGEPAPTEPGGPEDPDRALRAEVGRAEARLTALYVASTATLPTATATRLRLLGERHEAYRQAIDPDRLADLLASGSPTPSASPSTGLPPGSANGTPSPSTSTSPSTTPAGVVRALRAGETEAARARASQSVRAVDPELARVIVLAGAGAAAAAQVLSGGAG